MAEHFGFFDAVRDANGIDDRVYNAEQFTIPFDALVTNGVVRSAYEQLEVVTSGSNMISRVKSGIAFIEGHHYFNDGIVELTHDVEVLGMSRIDRVVIRKDSNPESRYVKAFIKKGAPSTNPVAPTLTQTPTVYEISLAQVRVNGGQTFIAANAVTDERGKDIICPWAGSNILPSFDENALGDHMNDATMHVKYGIDTGTGNLKTVQVDGITEYVDGLAIAFKVNATFPTGTAAININGLGNKTVKRPNGTNFPASQLYKDGIYTFRFNVTANSFIVQGEGGEYGDVTAPQVLVGRTFGTENGLVTGTMPNKSGQTTVGTQISSSSTLIDLVPTAGYYDGTNSSRVRISNANFIPANIKKNVNIFGVVGTFGEKYATGQAYSTTGGSEYININNLGFRPRVVIAKLANMADKNRYAAVYMFSPTVMGDLDFRMTDSGTVYANSSIYVNDNQFRLQVDSINSRLYNWMAFGSEDF